MFSKIKFSFFINIQNETNKNSNEEFKIQQISKPIISEETISFTREITPTNFTPV